MKKENKISFKNLGKRIQKERLRKEYTINEFAIKTKIRPEYMKKIEIGEAVRLKLHHLSSICNALEITLYELLDEP